MTLNLFGHLFLERTGEKAGMEEVSLQYTDFSPIGKTSVDAADNNLMTRKYTHSANGFSVDVMIMSGGDGAWVEYIDVSGKARPTVEGLFAEVDLKTGSGAS